MNTHRAWSALGLPPVPLFLAPLAGVSDSPFRRICSMHGADLTYVEMISASALVMDSRQTIAMLHRHPSEERLGVQVTSRTPDEMARAVEILHSYGFSTIDLNMGCPVRKVVQTGCGSAILRDPERITATVKAARQATDLPLSVKVRLGWDRESTPVDEIADAVVQGGADWLTIHGRYRVDDYSIPVDVGAIARVKARLSIPVVFNGNILTADDGKFAIQKSGTDGVMVSRGALGNPWIFREIRGESLDTCMTPFEWLQTIRLHIQWQGEEYPDRPVAAAVRLRKHLLWYASGWPGVRDLRQRINALESLSVAQDLFEIFVSELAQNLQNSVRWRSGQARDVDEKRFLWNPKWDIERQDDGHIAGQGPEVVRSAVQST